MTEPFVTRAEHERLEYRVEELERARAVGLAIRGGIMNSLRTFGPLILAALAILVNRLSQIPPAPGGP